MPPFVMVKVPPLISSIVSLLFFAFVASSTTAASTPAILKLSALRITGTTKPFGALTAIDISQ